MPAVNPPDQQWLAHRLAQMSRDIAQLKTQQTQFILDSSQAAQAITGNLSHDHKGNPTGLSGFGQAVWNGSAWAKVNQPDTNGNAAFLQLLFSGQVVVDHGTASLNFGGTTAASLVVAHGLGRSPLRILVTMNGNPGFTISFSADTRTTSQFTLHGVAAATVAGAVGVDWIALG